MREYLLREFRRLELEYDKHWSDAMDRQDTYDIAYYSGMREAIHKAYNRVKFY